METINKLRKFYELKNVERSGPVGKRKESSAEHSWSCLILADYFLTIMKDKDIDRLKVYELLMYHDIVEIEAGDIPIHHEKERENKKDKEKKALESLKNKVPEVLSQKFVRLFNEFEERVTKEARFAKAIDSMDALIHFLDYKTFWKGWNEGMLRKFQGSNLGNFKEIKVMFEKLIDYVKKEGYLNQ